MLTTQMHSKESTEMNPASFQTAFKSVCNDAEHNYTQQVPTLGYEDCDPSPSNVPLPPSAGKSDR